MARPKKSEESNVIPLQRQSGSNITALKRDIGEVSNQIIALKKDRAGINAEIAECRAKAERMGIKKQALDLAIRYREMDAEQRENFDESYSLAREANGVPFSAQLDMFDEETDASPANAPRVVLTPEQNAAEQAEGEAALAV